MIEEKVRSNRTCLLSALQRFIGFCFLNHAIWVVPDYVAKVMFIVLLSLNATTFWILILKSFAYGRRSSAG